MTVITFPPPHAPRRQGAQPPPDDPIIPIVVAIARVAARLADLYCDAPEAAEAVVAVFDAALTNVEARLRSEQP